MESYTPTIVWTVCDLGAGGLVVYYFHDFEQPLRFNLREELTRKRHGGVVGDMVTVKPYIATVYERARGRSIFIRMSAASCRTASSCRHRTIASPSSPCPHPRAS